MVNVSTSVCEEIMRSWVMSGKLCEHILRLGNPFMNQSTALVNSASDHKPQLRIWLCLETRFQDKTIHKMSKCVAVFEC